VQHELGFQVRRAWLWLALTLGLVHCNLAWAAPVQVRFSVLPTSVAISALQYTVAHDLVLRDALRRRGAELQLVVSKRKLSTIADMGAGRLDVCVLGDVSMVRDGPAENVTGVAMLGVVVSSVIGRDIAQLSQLAGKRVAFTPKTIGEQALLRALAAAKLRESDIKPVPMQVAEMTAALARGEIDAFAAWEPTPQQALKLHPEYTQILRHESALILMLGNDFMARQPELAKLLLGAFARAHRWLAVDGRNRYKAVGWALAASGAEDNEPLSISVDEGVGILRSSLLDVKGLPMLSNSWVGARGDGQRLFAFLQATGQLRPGASWPQVQAHLNRRLMDALLVTPAVNQLDEFRYAP